MSDNRDKPLLEQGAKPASAGGVDVEIVDADIEREFDASAAPTREVQISELPPKTRPGSEPTGRHVVRRSVVPPRAARTGRVSAEGSGQLVIGRVADSAPRLPRNAAERSTLPEPTLWNAELVPPSEVLVWQEGAIPTGNAWQNDALGAALRKATPPPEQPGSDAPLSDFQADLARLEELASDRQFAQLRERVAAFADLKLDRDLAARGAWQGSWARPDDELDMLAQLERWQRGRDGSDPELELAIKLRNALLAREPLSADGLQELLGQAGEASLAAEVRTWLAANQPPVEGSPVLSALAEWRRVPVPDDDGDETENTEEHPRSAILRTAYALIEGFDPSVSDQAHLATMLERTFRRLHAIDSDSLLALDLATQFARRAGDRARELSGLEELLRTHPQDPRVTEWAQRRAFLDPSETSDGLLDEVHAADNAGRARAAGWRLLGQRGKFRELAERLGEASQDGGSTLEAKVLGYRAAAWLGDETNADTLVVQWMAELLRRLPDFCVAQSLVRIGDMSEAPMPERRRDRRETGSATWLAIRAAEQAEWTGDPAAALAMYRSSLSSDSLERAKLYEIRAEIATGATEDPPWDAAQRRLGVELPRKAAEMTTTDRPSEEERFDLYSTLAARSSDDPPTAAAFWLRAAEAARRNGKYEQAREAYQKAMPGCLDRAVVHSAWRLAAIVAKNVDDMYQAALLEAETERVPARRAALFHLCAVIAMEHRQDKALAALLLEKAVSESPGHRDAYLRLRSIWQEEENSERLLWLLTQRLPVETGAATRVELMSELARIHRDVEHDLPAACDLYREILKLDPGNRPAIRELADAAWELGRWDDAADMLLLCARIAEDSRQRAEVYYKLGVLYADHLDDRRWALESFGKAAASDPDDPRSLVRMVELRIAAKEWEPALQAAESLMNRTGPGVEVARWGRYLARIHLEGFNDRTKAERAYIRALEADPACQATLEAIVDFYADDKERVRVYLDRLGSVLCGRLSDDSVREETYRTLARIQGLRADAGVPGARAVSRFAAQSALLLGSTDSVNQATAAIAAPELRLVELGVFENEQLLFPETVQPELRSLLSRLGGRLGKYMGRDASELGVHKEDAVRDRAHPVLSVLREVANALCVSEPELYVSKRKPDAFVIEPTQPATLVLGKNIAALPEPQLRFLAGSALFSVRTALAIPLRLEPAQFAVFLRALLTPFDVPAEVFAPDSDAVNAEIARCKKLVPGHMLVELRPYALAICGSGYLAQAIWDGMQRACHRAGLLVAGEMAAGVAALARVGGYESIQADGRMTSTGALAREGGYESIQADPAHPLVRDLMLFAASDEMARLCAIMGD